MEGPVKAYADMSCEELEGQIGGPKTNVPQAQFQLVPAVILLGRITKNVKEGVEDLTKSSNRLESLTKWLIGLTIVLAFFTLVLAVPEIRNLVAWLKAR